MRRFKSGVTLLSLVLVSSMIGCTGTPSKRSSRLIPWRSGSYRTAEIPTREGWSEPSVFDQGEGQRLGRFFPGLSGRSRVYTDSAATVVGKPVANPTAEGMLSTNPPAAGKLIAKLNSDRKPATDRMATPASTRSARVAGPGQPSANPETPSSGTAGRAKPTEPDLDLPPPFLPTAMTVPSPSRSGARAVIDEDVEESKESVAADPNADEPNAKKKIEKVEEPSLLDISARVLASTNDPTEAPTDPILPVAESAETLTDGLKSKEQPVAQVEALKDKDTVATNLEEPVFPPAPPAQGLPPIPDVNPIPRGVPVDQEPEVPAVAVAPGPDLGPDPASEAEPAPTPRASAPRTSTDHPRPRARPVLDVEELAPRIARAEREEPLDSVEVPPSIPPVPPVDPLTGAATQPLAPGYGAPYGPTNLYPGISNYQPMPTPAYVESAKASTTLVRPRWVPFRRDSAVFNKPLATSSDASIPSWQFWNRPTPAVVRPPLGEPVPQPGMMPNPSQPKGWFGTNYGTKSRALIFGSGS